MEGKLITRKLKESDNITILRAAALAYKLANKCNIKGFSYNEQEYKEFLKNYFERPLLCSGEYCFCEGCPDELEIIIATDIHDLPEGAVVFVRDEDHGYIMDIFVTQDNLGKGFGKVLLSRALLWLRRYQPATEFIQAQCVNNASVKLVESFGFKQDNTGDYFLDFQIDDWASKCAQFAIV